MYFSIKVTAVSIKLRFDKGSLSTQVVLKDEALPLLLEIISKHQSDEIIAPISGKATGTSTVSAVMTSDDSVAVRDWLSKHSPSEILGQITWDTYPEKILLLGAFQEAAEGGEWKSSDIERRFGEARQQPPGNFGRDVSQAIKSQWVATVTPRTYKVSRTGWAKIAEALDQQSA
jgi:hypothetical protein